MPTHYEYSGYLRSLLKHPPLEEIERANAIEIPARDIAQWPADDDGRDPEWRHIPAECVETEEGAALLRGNFERVRQIDATGPNDPSFWVPLTCMESDSRCVFPLELSRYSVVEITYRCLTPHCRPAWQFYYPGGLHFDWLRPSTQWVTKARLIQHRGFPEQITGMTLRLYSVSRSVQEWEIQSIRFRALTHTEIEALVQHEHELSLPEAQPKHYPILDSFVPLGVCVDANAGRAMASQMDMAFRDYWRIAMEDIARSHHNCLMVENVAELSETETAELLGLATSFGLRVVPLLNWSPQMVLARGQELVDKYVRPHAESDALLAWCLQGEPPEHAFEAYMKAKPLFEATDELHPLIYLTRDPNSMALYAPHFPVTGLSYFKSGDPWSLGDSVRTHLPLVKGQQLWVTAPAYIYATGTPRWNTCPEARLMINHAFGSGARGWFAFSYHNVPIWLSGPFKRSLSGPFLTFSDLWIELSHRVERFVGLSSLLLRTRPGDFWVPNVRISVQPHSNSRLPKGLQHVTWSWLHGEDFGILYVINNDIDQVTGVNIEIPSELPFGQECYDITDFVRSREWRTTERFRHLEMFPGQAQMFLFAPPHVALRERDHMIAYLLEDDRRQLGLDLGLARRYGQDITEAQELIRRFGLGHPIDDLQAAKKARDGITNTMYRHAPFAQARSAILESSAALCGCDGALTVLYDRGRIDEAHERGVEVMNLSRRLMHLRLRMRRGQGGEIIQETRQLAEEMVRMLGELREGH